MRRPDPDAVRRARERRLARRLGPTAWGYEPESAPPAQDPDPPLAEHNDPDPHPPRAA
jgi:hypothetical protein